MKAKKMKKMKEALQQMAEEGVVQVFSPHDGAPGDRAPVEKFMASHRFSMADDLDGDPVFLASSAFNLRYEAERAGEGVRFTDVKDYQRG